MKAEDWIRVEDRLPKEGTPVLVFTWNNRLEIGTLLRERWHFNYNDYSLDVITHWMPIELPKEEKE